MGRMGAAEVLCSNSIGLPVSAVLLSAAVLCCLAGRALAATVTVANMSN